MINQTGGVHTTDKLWFVYNQDSNSVGDYNLSGGQLFTGNVWLSPGYTNSTFRQTGGQHAVNNTLTIGGSIYDLSGSVYSSSLSTTNTLISSGAFIQSGGTHIVSGALTVGQDVSGGNYNLSDGILNTADVIVGDGGLGHFYQSGGTHNVSGVLALGRNAGDANYNLDGGILKTQEVIVGDTTSGKGHFYQVGGQHNIAGVDSNMVLGSEAGTVGTYDLYGNGALSVDSTHGGLGVGIRGTGTFTLTDDASLRVRGDEGLVLGYYDGGGGTFVLDSGLFGTLDVYKVRVGRAGTGVFQHDSGTYGTNSLSLAEQATGNGTYILNGGALYTLGVSSGAGTSNIFISNGSMYAGGIYNGSGTSTITINGGTLTSNSIAVDNFNVGDAAGVNVNFALLDGQLLDVADSEVIGRFGTGNIVQVGVTHNANKLYLGHVGNFGYLTLPTGVGSYDMSGGSLTTQEEYIGYNGVGTFTQSGGTHTAGTAVIGTGGLSYPTAGLDGRVTDTVIPGGWLTTFDCTGYFCSYAVHKSSAFGTYTQSGGTYNVENALYLGRDAGGIGSYDLSGTGSLSTQDEYIGYGAAHNFVDQSGYLIDHQDGGIGTFTQSGGMHAVSNDLYLGYYGGSNGSYELSGTGSLTVQHNEYIGYDGTHTYPVGTDPNNPITFTQAGSVGTFTQNGGTHTVGNNLYLAVNQGSSGTYNLNGGTLTVGNIVRGAGNSAFNFNAGTLNITGATGLTVGSTGPLGNNLSLDASKSLNVTNALTINAGSAVNVVGGTLSFGSIGLGAGSLLNFNAGTLNITGATGLTVGSTGPLGNNLNLDASKSLNVANGLTIDAGSTVNVAGGTLTAGNATNNGTLTSNSTLTIGSALANAGALALSGGTITGNINNTGVVNVSNTVTHTGTLTQTAGVTTVNGTLSTNGVDIQGGMLKGSGSIVGNVLNSAGTMAVGNSPGSMTITGDYTQSMAGIFDVELGGLIAGSQYDTLNVTGTANLDGTLKVSLFDLGGGLFTPHQGDTFDILSAEHLNGNFSALTLASLSGGLQWNIAYLIDANGTTDVVRLSVVSSSGVYGDPAPVPVPAAVWLFGSGLLGLAGVARKRKAA